VDCGPGNPRLADALSVYRRGAAQAQLVVLSESTPALAAAIVGLEGCLVLAPDDLPRLGAAIARACPEATSEVAPRQVLSGGAADPAAAPDRAEFFDFLSRALAGGSASVTLVVAVVPPGLTDAAARAALEAAGQHPITVSALAPDRIAALVDVGPIDAGQDISLAERLRDELRRRASPVDGGRAVALSLCPPRPSDPNSAAWLARAEQACLDVAAQTEHGYAVLGRMPGIGPSARSVPALIHEALLGDRLALAFQPIVSLRGDAREHYEALIRLPTASAGEMLPGDFLAAAESAGLLPAVDQWVARAALRRLARERGRGRRAHFFVALSGAGLRDGRVAITLCDELPAAGARGDWLTVQLRVRDVIRHPAEARRLVAALRQIRCGIALDRYEHDVSAREAVEQLDFDIVKLSPALTRGAATDQTRWEALYQAVRWLSGRGARTVATAVEDPHALAYLWACGVDYAQGYFLQEPTAEIGYDSAD
jgi:EAL domain-containing protein (putative c-di-GMP-specific phosphodiesterase class I)